MFKGLVRLLERDDGKVATGSQDIAKDGELERMSLYIDACISSHDQNDA